MKICFLSYSNSGGAGKATIKVINSLKKINIRCDHKYILDNNNFSFVHNLRVFRFLNHQFGKNLINLTMT